MSQPKSEPSNNWEAKLRRVRYERWTGIWGSWEAAEASLLAFVYDSYTSVGACGVFPPFRRLNQFLLHGGYGGGMGPGAKWEPFAISQEEYDLLVEAIRSVPPESIERLTDYVPLPFSFDPEFDGGAASYPIYPGYKDPTRAIQHLTTDLADYFKWMSAVCGKHRETWCAANRRRGESQGT